MTQNLRQIRMKRKLRVRSSTQGTKAKPRLSVFRSNRSIYAQIIDDRAGKTLAAACAGEVKDKAVKKTERAYLVGKLLAEKAGAKKITRVVFDRGGYKFHGRVKAVAAGARENGLQF